LDRASRTAACPAVDRFIDRLIELELPLPDDGWREGPFIALDWYSLTSNPRDWAEEKSTRTRSIRSPAARERWIA
jgi:hypothetical protein